jgi:hypothetical protein
MPSIRNLRRVVGAALAAGALLAPAVASADDQNVYNAFHNSHPRFKELRRDFERGEDNWARSEWRDPSEAYSALRKTQRLAEVVMERLRERKTSTTTGEKARRRSVRGINHRRKWSVTMRKAIEAFMRYDGSMYIELKDRAEGYLDTAQRYEEKAQQLWEQTDVKG